MKIGVIFSLSLVILIAVAGYLTYTLKLKSENVEKLVQNAKNEAVSGCKPAFRDGGGPYYLPKSPFRSKIVPDVNKGDQLLVSGKVVMNDCITPANNAVLDIWQANESGNYEDTWYRGQIKTDSEGNYLFETVVPKGYGEGTGYRPPHIHFKVFIDNKEIVTSQMFFPESKGTPGFDDAYIMKVESLDEGGKKLYKASHTIFLP